MANYLRTIKTEMWNQRNFRSFKLDEKMLYVYLHTADISSDCSAFLTPMDRIQFDCQIRKARVPEILRSFEEQGLILYDYETEEVCVRDYFYHHPPIGGLTYEMLRKDLAKIQSHTVIAAVIEQAHKYEINLAFFVALKDISETFGIFLNQADFKIRKTKQSEDDVRNAAAKGRNSPKRNAAELSAPTDDALPY